MKKILFFLSLLPICIGSLSAQNVSIQFSDIHATSYTVTITPDEGVDFYRYYTDVVGGIDAWVPMMGSVEAVVNNWGILAESADSHTFTELVPGTDYVLYVVANGALFTDTVTTLTVGGTGEAFVELSVDGITNTSCTTHCTPNEHTAMYKYLIMTEELFENIGEDSAANFVKTDTEEFYEAHDWNWLTLAPGTSYKLLAIAQNANSEWGPLAKYSFSTTGLAGIEQSFDNETFVVYPNPASDRVSVQGVPADAEIQILDMSGRLLMARHGVEEISVEGLPSGLYLIRIISGSDAETHSLIVR